VGENRHCGGCATSRCVYGWILSTDNYEKVSGGFVAETDKKQKTKSPAKPPPRLSPPCLRNPPLVGSYLLEPHDLVFQHAAVCCRCHWDCWLFKHDL
jgi:hypothetical protein